MNRYGKFRPAYNISERLCNALIKDKMINKSEQTTILQHLHWDWMTSLLAEAWSAISCLIHPAGTIKKKPQVRQNNRRSSIRNKSTVLLLLLLLRVLPLDCEMW